MVQTLPIIHSRMKFVILVLSCVTQIFADNARLVEVDQGLLEGIAYTIPNGRIVTAFLGVPYAASPVYEKRFMAPQEAKPWTGIFNASTLPSGCLQYSDFIYKVIGEEDCLYLSVYTPNLKATNHLLDVLVFIHGGAFMFGDGNHAPDYILMDNNIVYVTINYRLGILGFMSTGDPLLPGNNGLKDQVAALKWVKKNIAKFGGNPESITISGSSAGGASVHYHFLSDMSNGLFHKGIAYSGSALPQWTLPRNNTDRSIHVAAMAGCPTSPIYELVKCLRRRPARQIVELGRLFTGWKYEPFTAFGPTIEPQNPDSFLTDHPIHLMKSGLMKDLPFLITLCKEEGLYRAAAYVADESALRELETKWNLIAPNMFMYNYSVANEAERDHVSETIKKYYFGNQPVSERTVQQLIQAYGDRAFYNDIVKAMKIQAVYNERQIYCFKFSYRGKYSVSDLMTHNSVDYGVSHADDVSYIIFLNSLANMTENETDRAMIQFLGGIVTRFMKHGDVEIENWYPVSTNISEKFRCLEIHSPEEYNMVDYEDTQTTQFWQDLLPLENIE